MENKNITLENINKLHEIIISRNYENKEYKKNAFFKALNIFEKEIIHFI